MKGHEDTPLYTIGIASSLLDCEPSALRRYEKAGLVEPERTDGKTRLYSENQLERLRDIQELIKDEEVNMAGVQIIMNLRTEMEKMNQEIAWLKEEMARLREELGRRK